MINVHSSLAEEKSHKPTLRTITQGDSKKEHFEELVTKYRATIVSNHFKKKKNQAEILKGRQKVVSFFQNASTSSHKELLTILLKILAEDHDDSKLSSELSRTAHSLADLLADNT